MGKVCTKKKPCEGMGYALDRPDRRDRTGIEFMIVMDMESTKMIPLGYVYRRTSKDNGIVFNYCPFCGADYVKIWPARRQKGVLK